MGCLCATLWRWQAVVLGILVLLTRRRCNAWLDVDGSIKIFQVPKSWDVARAVCADAGMTLKTVSTAEENVAILRAVAAPTSDFGVSEAFGFWIGLRDVNRDGIFTWDNGSPSTYRNWYNASTSGERIRPNPVAEGTHCVEIDTRGALAIGRWNDVSCSQMRPFICSAPADATASAASASNCFVPAFNVIQRSNLPLAERFELEFTLSIFDISTIAGPHEVLRMLTSNFHDVSILVDSGRVTLSLVDEARSCIRNRAPTTPVGSETLQNIATWELCQAQCLDRELHPLCESWTWTNATHSRFDRRHQCLLHGAGTDHDSAVSLGFDWSCRQRQCQDCSEFVGAGKCSSTGEEPWMGKETVDVLIRVTDKAYLAIDGQSVCEFDLPRRRQVTDNVVVGSSGLDPVVPNSMVCDLALHNRYFSTENIDYVRGDLFAVGESDFPLRDECLLYGGDMVSVHSNEQNQELLAFLNTLPNTHNGAYIGLRYSQTSNNEREFEWTDGSGSDYLAPFSSTPQTHDCVQITDAGSWEGAHCDGSDTEDTRRHTICRFGNAYAVDECQDGCAMDDVCLRVPALASVRCCSDDDEGECTPVCQLTTFMEAKHICEDKSMRLCTREEIVDERLCACRSCGAHEKFRRVWTSDLCQLPRVSEGVHATILDPLLPSATRSWQACQDECRGDPLCGAWSWSSDNVCSTGRGVDEAELAPVTGDDVEAFYCAEKECHGDSQCRSWYYSDVENAEVLSNGVPVSNRSECCQLCASHGPDCLVARYGHEDRMCWPIASYSGLDVGISTTSLVWPLGAPYFQQRTHASLRTSLGAGDFQWELLEASDFFSALSTCEQRGGSLVSVHSQSEFDRLSERAGVDLWEDAEEPHSFSAWLGLEQDLPPLVSASITVHKPLDIIGGGEVSMTMNSESIGVVSLVPVCNGDRAEGGCCSFDAPCGPYEGDCNDHEHHSDCKDDLECGRDNCNDFGLGFPDNTWDCCVPPGEAKPCVLNGYPAVRSSTSDIIMEVETWQLCEEECEATPNQWCESWVWRKEDHSVTSLRKTCVLYGAGADYTTIVDDGTQLSCADTHCRTCNDSQTAHPSATEGIEEIDVGCLDSNEILKDDFSVGSHFEISFTYDATGSISYPEAERYRHVLTLQKVVGNELQDMILVRNFVTSSWFWLSTRFVRLGFGGFSPIYTSSIEFVIRVEGRHTEFYIDGELVTSTIDDIPLWPAESARFIGNEFFGAKQDFCNVKLRNFPTDTDTARCTSELSFSVLPSLLSSVYDAVLPGGEPLSVGITHTDSLTPLAFSHAVLEATFARQVSNIVGRESDLLGETLENPGTTVDSLSARYCTPHGSTSNLSVGDCAWLQPVGESFSPIDKSPQILSATLEISFVGDASGMSVFIDESFAGEVVAGSAPPAGEMLTFGIPESLLPALLASIETDEPLSISVNGSDSDAGWAIHHSRIIISRGFVVSRQFGTPPVSRACALMPDPLVSECTGECSFVLDVEGALAQTETMSNRQASYWTWVDGTYPSEALWYKYQPDNNGVLGAQCAEFGNTLDSRDPGWSDTSCDQALPAVCLIPQRPTCDATPLTTDAPTSVPTTSDLTLAPSPTPTRYPSPAPTAAPTTVPTPGPTGAPTPVPTGAPTPDPTGAPTLMPTLIPTEIPTPLPSPAPTLAPLDPVPIDDGVTCAVEAEGFPAVLLPFNATTLATDEADTPFGACCRVCEENAECNSFAFNTTSCYLFEISSVESPDANAADRTSRVQLLQDDFEGDVDLVARDGMRFALISREAVETSVGSGDEEESTWDALWQDTIFLLTVCTATVFFILFLLSHSMEKLALKRKRERDRRETARARISIANRSVASQSVAISEDAATLSARSVEYGQENGGGAVRGDTSRADDEEEVEMHRRYDRGKGKHGTILLVGLTLVDLAVDWGFVIERFKLDIAKRNAMAAADLVSPSIPLIPSLALVFLFIPMMINLYLTLRLMRSEFQRQHMRDWFFDNSMNGTLILLLSLGNAEALSMFTSKVFGSLEPDSMFNAPMSRKAGDKLFWVGIGGNLLEDFPQLCIQTAVVLLSNEEVTIITQIAMSTSAATLIFGILRRTVFILIFSEQRVDVAGKKAATATPSVAPRNGGRPARLGGGDGDRFSGRHAHSAANSVAAGGGGGGLVARPPTEVELGSLAPTVVTQLPEHALVAGRARSASSDLRYALENFIQHRAKDIDVARSEIVPLFSQQGGNRLGPHDAQARETRSEVYPYRCAQPMHRDTEGFTEEAPITPIGQRNQRSGIAVPYTRPSLENANTGVPSRSQTSHPHYVDTLYAQPNRRAVGGRHDAHSEAFASPSYYPEVTASAQSRPAESRRFDFDTSEQGHAADAAEQQRPRMVRTRSASDLRHLLTMLKSQNTSRRNLVSQNATIADRSTYLNDTEMAFVRSRLAHDAEEMKHPSHSATDVSRALDTATTTTTPKKLPFSSFSSHAPSFSASSPSGSQGSRKNGSLEAENRASSSHLAPSRRSSAEDESIDSTQLSPYEQVIES